MKWWSFCVNRHCRLDDRWIVLHMHGENSKRSTWYVFFLNFILLPSYCPFYINSTLTVAQQKISFFEIFPHFAVRIFAVSKEEFVLVLFIHFLCARNFIFSRYVFFFFLHLAIFGNSILKRQLQSGQCALSDKFILSWMRFMLIQSIWQTLFNLESSAIVFAHWVQMHFFVLFSFNNFSLPTTSLSFNLSSIHK